MSYLWESFSLHFSYVSFECQKSKKKKKKSKFLLLEKYEKSELAFGFVTPHVKNFFLKSDKLGHV